jgi:hypothetical protein
MIGRGARGTLGGMRQCGYEEGRARKAAPETSVGKPPVRIRLQVISRKLKILPTSALLDSWQRQLAKTIYEMSHQGGWRRGGGPNAGEGCGAGYGFEPPVVKDPKDGEVVVVVAQWLVRGWCKSMQRQKVL